jgi:hypothetical protein
LWYIAANADTIKNVRSANKAAMYFLVIVLGFVERISHAGSAAGRYSLPDREAKCTMKDYNRPKFLYQDF